MDFFSATELHSNFQRSQLHLHRNTRYIKLSNGLRVLLISDSHSPITAASICIGVGKFTDTEKFPGLAHFCNQMIFLGKHNNNVDFDFDCAFDCDFDYDVDIDVKNENEKVNLNLNVNESVLKTHHSSFIASSTSSSHDFCARLRKMGGKFHLNTLGDQSTFQFEVPLTNASFISKDDGESDLTNLFKTFSSGFKQSQLQFNEKWINLELSLIENKHHESGEITHNGICASRDKLLFYGMRLLANEQHPFRKIATETTTEKKMETLKNKKLKQEMMTHYDKHFVAEKMVLVLKSSLSLNQLQKLAIAHFGDIPSESEYGKSKRKGNRRHSRSSTNSSSSSGSSSGSSSKNGNSRLGVGYKLGRSPNMETKSSCSSSPISTFLNEFNSNGEMEVYPLGYNNQVLWIKQYPKQQQKSNLLPQEQQEQQQQQEQEKGQQQQQLLPLLLQHNHQHHQHHQHQNQYEKQARLVFPIYQLNETFFEKVWCSVLGDQSPASLSYYLKHELKVINSLHVHMSKFTRENQALLIDLEYKSSCDLNVIICAIWNLIEQLLNAHPKLVHAMLLEYSRIFKFQACFAAPGTCLLSSGDEVSRYAKQIQYGIDPKDIFIGEECAKQNIDATTFINRTKEIFIQQVPNLIIIDDECSHMIALPSDDTRFIKDPIYNFEYALMSLKYTIDETVFPIYRFLVPNKYIKHAREELDLLLEDSANYTQLYPPDIVEDSSPQMIDHSISYEVWHSRLKSSDRRITVSFLIELSERPNLIQTIISTELIAQYLGEQLKIEFHHAESALLSWGIYANFVNRPSLAFEVHGPDMIGFESFLYDFIKRTKELLSTFEPEYKEFVRLKTDARAYFASTGYWLNANKANNKEDVDDVDDVNNDDVLVDKQIIVESTKYLEHSVISVDEIFDQLELLNKQDIKVVSNEYVYGIKRTFILVSGSFGGSGVSGNFGCSGGNGLGLGATKSTLTVHTICDIINILTSHKRVYMEHLAFEQPQSILLEPGTNDVVKIGNSVLSHNNSDVVYYYLQMCQRRNKYTLAVVEFLAYLLNREAKAYFHRIRKKQQKQQIRGYRVSSGIRTNKQTVGIYIYVKNDHRKCAGIQKYHYCGSSHSQIKVEIENMLNDWEKRLMAISSDELRYQIDQYNKFRLNINGKVEREVGENNNHSILSNALVSTRPNFSSANIVMHKLHQTNWENILTKNYDDFESLRRHHMEYLTDWDVESIHSFFKKHVSVRSTWRSSLTVSLVFNNDICNNNNNNSNNNNNNNDSNEARDIDGNTTKRVGDLKKQGLLEGRSLSLKGMLRGLHLY